MPALPPVPGVIKMVQGGFIDNERNQNWANVLHWQYSGTAPSSAQLNTLAAQIGTQWGVNMAATCPSPTTMTLVTLTDLTGPTAGAGESNVSHAGTRGDDSIPANAALLIHYQVNFRYRGGKPRTYLYCGGNADLEGAGKWNALFAQAVQDAWRNYLSALSTFSTGSGTLGNLVLVRYQDKTINPVPPHKLTSPLVLTQAITTAIADPQMASQRGRIGRSRRNASAGVP